MSAANPEVIIDVRMADMRVVLKCETAHRWSLMSEDVRYENDDVSNENMQHGESSEIIITDKEAGAILHLICFNDSEDDSQALTDMICKLYETAEPVMERLPHTLRCIP